MDRLRMLCLQLVLIMATSGCDSPTTAIISADATALARTTCSTRALEIRGAASSWNVFKSTCGLNALSGLAVLRGGRETREEDLDWTEFPRFTLENPDPNEPVKFAEKPGRFVDFEVDIPAEVKNEIKESRSARLERLRRRREGVVSDEETQERSACAKKIDGGDDDDDDDDDDVDFHCDPQLVESIMNETDIGIWRSRYLAEVIKDESEREMTEELFKFQEFHNASWDPRDMTEKDVETFLRETNESTRTDNFTYLPREVAEKVQKSWDKLEAFYPPAPSLVEQSPIPRLCTWIQSGLGQYGIMWDVEAKGAPKQPDGTGRDVTIHKIHACSASSLGPQRYALYTAEGKYKYKSQSERLWTIIGGGVLDLPSEPRKYAEVPLDRTVLVRAGATQAFYLHCLTDENGVAFRTRPLVALDAGPHCAPDSFKYIPAKDGEPDGAAIDGVLYSESLAGEGQVVDRDEHLLVRTAAFAPTPRPFEDVAVDANSVIAWAGLIDYVPRAEAAARAQASRPLEEELLGDFEPLDSSELDSSERPSRERSRRR